MTLEDGVIVAKSGGVAESLGEVNQIPPLFFISSYLIALCLLSDARLLLYLFRYNNMTFQNRQNTCFVYLYYLSYKLSQGQAWFICSTT